MPEPFQLAGDALHQHAEAAKQQYLEEEERKRKAQAAFKVCPTLLYDVLVVLDSCHLIPHHLSTCASRDQVSGFEAGSCLSALLSCSSCLAKIPLLHLC